MTVGIYNMAVCIVRQEIRIVALAHLPFTMREGVFVSLPQTFSRVSCTALAVVTNIRETGQKGWWDQSQAVCRCRCPPPLARLALSERCDTESGCWEMRTPHYGLLSLSNIPGIFLFFASSCIPPFSFSTINLFFSRTTMNLRMMNAFTRKTLVTLAFIPPRCIMVV